MKYTIKSSTNLIESAGLEYQYAISKEEPDSALMLLVHGKAGNDSLMWPFSKTFQQLNANTIAPQAPLPDNSTASPGHSWWSVSTKSKEFPEQLNAATCRLEDFIDNAIASHKLNPKEIHIMGFSQGAAIISSLALKHPSLFCSVTMLAGFLPKAALELFLPLRAKLPRFFLAHGTKDEIVPYPISEESAKTLESLKADVTFCSDPVGHKVGSNSLKKLKTWYETHYTQG